MVYTKLYKEEDAPEETELTLINYCKNCSWKGVLPNTDEAIYKRNYENDFIADRILNNKYTIYDNALPRLNIPCVSDNCITNLEDITGHAFIIHNLPETTVDKDINKMLTENSDGEKVINKIRLKLTSVVIVTASENDKLELMDKYNNQNLDGNDLKTESYTKPKNEVLYIKYDPENMKYLYMCVNCGSSWQGNY